MKLRKTNVCPECKINEMDGTITCWDCFGQSNFRTVCECGVHITTTVKEYTNGKCYHIEPEIPTASWISEEPQQAVDKIVESVLRTEYGLTHPMSKEFRYSLEYTGVEPAEDIPWTPEMRKAYYMNRIDMALIAGDKEEFLLWSGKLNRYKAIRERKEA